MRTIHEFDARLARIEEEIAYALPQGTDFARLKSESPRIPDAVRPNHVIPLIEPARNLVSRGGKRWRPLLLILVAELADGDIAKAYRLAALIELIHTASLIHDDIEDNADQRRGNPAIHIKYGLDTAVNTGSCLYFHALSIIQHIPSSETLKNHIYQASIQAIINLHLGQSMDIEWHKNIGYIPNRAEYMAMISLKTSTLVQLAAELGILCAGKSLEEARVVAAMFEPIGIGFQILDDVTNLTTGNHGKKRGDDIVEGKKSLPLLYHVEKHPDDISKIKNCFTHAHTEGITSPAVEECISLLTKSGAIARAKEKGNKLLQTAFLQLYGRYPRSPVIELIELLFRQ